MSNTPEGRGALRAELAAWFALIDNPPVPHADEFGMAWQARKDDYSRRLLIAQRATRAALTAPPAPIPEPASNAPEGLIEQIDGMLEDPMWPGHCEISKVLLNRIRAALAAAPTPGA